MLTIILFCLLFTSNYGHTNIHTRTTQNERPVPEGGEIITKRVQNEAELQSALMPQELNPEFVPEKFTLMTGDQWNAVMPRTRRDTELAESESVASQTAVGEHVKHYGRIIAFVVLILSAVSEIVLYCIGVYYNN